MQQLNKLKPIFKSLWLLAACAFMFSACDIDGVVDYSGDATVVEDFSFEIAVRNQSRLRLEGVNGDIDIAGVPGASKVEIWGERRVKSKSTEDAKAHLKNLEVRVTDGAEEVFVKTIQPRETGGRTLEVIYTNGNVLLAKITGNTLIALVNGNVDAGRRYDGFPPALSLVVVIDDTNGGDLY
jgi:hypothetical protein